MAKIVLISCVSKKLDHEAEAQDLYTSPLFRLNLAYARRLQPDAIFILSAKYGLLDLRERVRPYDLTLNAMSAAEVRRWAGQVLEQLRLRSDPARDEYVFLAGANYRKYLAPHLRHVAVPLEGLRIGEQLSQLKEWVDE
ncbi:MAG: hypothetical protein KBI47_10680 [Armatimonadetes bacterium]|jgi:hypothetical protein|nr:hypothetical protein [Armatimonadota bacterium]MDI9585904.1 hypothetical protein [Acidobacteriota bacterium]